MPPMSTATKAFMRAIILAGCKGGNGLIDDMGLQPCKKIPYLTRLQSQALVYSADLSIMSYMVLCHRYKGGQPCVPSLSYIQEQNSL